MPAISALAVIAATSPPTRAASNEVGGITRTARRVRTRSSAATWMQAGDQTADSYSDSNTGGWRRSTASASAGGIQVRNARERC